MTHGEVIFLQAGSSIAKQVRIPSNKRLSSLEVWDDWFPISLVPPGFSRVAMCTTQHTTGASDFYAVFYDGHNAGPPNSIVQWLVDVVPYKHMPSTGNFVIAHKKWIGGREVNAPIELDLDVLQLLFKC